MEDLTGKQLGPYRVIGPLGEGGMAAVYKAYQPGVDRQVALKILPQHYANSPEFVSRFEQEARLIANLEHAHIVPVYDFGEADGYTYLVMRFVKSGTLADILTPGDPLPLPQIRSIISQVGDALDYAHSQGIIHRDVKPSNILIDNRNNCLLTDFGIAKILEGNAKLTRTGGILGTPDYMSPEQIMGESLDGRSDIYALGVIVYELATGRTPFRAETPPAVLMKHLHDPLPPPHTLNPDLPALVEQVILKALAKQPEERYATASDMVWALQEAITDLSESVADAQVITGPANPPTESPLQALPVSPVTIATPKPKPARVVWPGGGLAALGLLLLLIAISVFVGNRLRSTPEPVALEPQREGAIVTMGAADPQSEVTPAAEGIDVAGVQAEIIPTATVGDEVGTVVHEATSGQTEPEAAPIKAMTGTVVTVSETTADQGVAPPAAKVMTETVSATPEKSPPASILFEDDFRENVNGWNLGRRSDEYSDDSAQITEGKYRRTLMSKRSVLWQENIPNFSAQDFWLRVEVTLVETSAEPGDANVSLIFRKNKSGNYYRVRFDNDGSYIVNLKQDGTWLTLQDWRSSEAIHFEVGVTNTFAILAEGSQITLFANDHLLTSLTDTSLSMAGKISLGIGLDEADQSLTVDFDNLVVAEGAGGG